MAEKHQSPRQYSLNATRGTLALVVLPLLLVVIGGGLVYFNFSNETEKEALTHSENVTNLLAEQASAFIRNKQHAVKLLAGEQLLQNSNFEHSPQPPKQLGNLLERYCTTLNASICYIMNVNGVTIADNNLLTEKTLHGKNYAFRDYFKNAMQGRDYVHLALGVTTKKRGIYFSSPIFFGSSIAGVAVIKFNPEQIEENFSGLSGSAVLVDKNDIIFASNNTDWLYKSLYPLSEQQKKQIAKSRQFGETEPETIGFITLNDGRVENSQNDNFIVNSQPVEALKGWKITYLLKPEHLYPIQQESQRNLVFAITFFLFLVTAIAVRQLYRTLKATINSNSEYQKEIEESKNRLQHFEQVSTEAIFIHNSDGVMYVNKQGEKLFGYSQKELKNLKPKDLFTQESLPTVLAHVESSSNAPYQANILTKNDQVIPVVVTGRSVTWNGEKARAASFRDIRNRIAVQKQLVASESRFRQLSDLVGEGLLIHTHGRIIDVNESFCKLMNEERKDLIAHPVSQLFGEAIFNALYAPHNEDDSLNSEIVFHRKDGSDFTAEVKTASMKFDDGLYSILTIKDISHHKEQKEKILYQAQFDLLTNIPNRLLARDRAEQAMKAADKHGTKLALLFVDLDGFKKVNDSLGHDVGDLLLQHASKRFISCVNDSDTVARHGGDEFIIILEDLNTPADAEIYIEKILEQFMKPFSIQNKELFVTTSIGVSIYPNDAQDYQSLLRAADIGMYKAKNDGKNTFHYYTQEMNEIATRKLNIDNNLRQAMEENEFSIVFQPLMQETGDQTTIAGAEALLRWNSKELGSVSPIEFIPLAEQTGLIVNIGRWVLQQACLQAKEWIDQNNDNFNISVNVSPRQFKGNDFVQDIKEALTLSKLPANLLSIEVTEGLLIQASPELYKTLNKITAMGVKICMDDFGTGYSSLNYLKTFPFNNLKIDRSFINEFPNNPDSNILVSATIAMAHQLGLSVTAEGIESQQQKEGLKNLNCDLLQGYLFGKPMSPDEFTHFLQRHRFKYKEGFNQPHSENSSTKNAL
ncbi:MULTISPECIES: EAL domain-containing protein [unclassified Neptuniibacter]|uniref:EAL domain-containing protein n=1 Tax=unclassified Neptuniibacter TaxID=2630693 RepID=UPI0025CFBED2|nr:MULTISPECIES: EAL domain-containing protein [unclassified Neptuniibacter]